MIAKSLVQCWTACVRYLPEELAVLEECFILAKAALYMCPIV